LRSTGTHQQPQRVSCESTPRSEESWEGLLARLLKGYSRKTLDKEIRSVLSHLKAEAERRAATA
jgi:hypothetical protein